MKIKKTLADSNKKEIDKASKTAAGAIAELGSDQLNDVQKQLVSSSAKWQKILEDLSETEKSIRELLSASGTDKLSEVAINDLNAALSKHYQGKDESHGGQREGSRADHHRHHQARDRFRQD